MSSNLFNLFLGQFLSDIFHLVDNTDFASCLHGTAIYDIGNSVDQITFSRQELLKKNIGLQIINSEGVSKNAS